MSRITAVLLGWSLVGMASAAVVDPPNIRWPAGWQVLHPPSPKDAQLSMGQTRAVLLEEGKPVAVIAVAYGQGKQPLAKTLQEAKVSGATFAGKAEMALSFGRPFHTRIGELPALAIEGHVARQGGQTLQEWLGVANGERQGYVVIYAASAASYSKHKPELEAALASFQVPPSDRVDEAKKRGEYGIYFLIFAIPVILLWNKARRRRPPPLPSTQQSKGQ